MKIGEGAGYFIADLADGIPDSEMRTRWQQGNYGTGKMQPTSDMVQGFRAMAGRQIISAGRG